MTDPQAPVVPTDPATIAAVSELAAARGALGDELVGLEAAARAAVDIRARIRRNPGRTAAAVGGTAFVVLGGPRRVLRSLKRRIVGVPDPLPTSLLPDQVETAVRALGDDGARVRGALERAFAGWLDATAKDRRAEARQRSAVNMAMKIALPMASQAAREAVSQAFRRAGGGTGPGGESSTR